MTDIGVGDRSFRLRDLFVLLGIVAVASLLALPAVQHVRENAAQVRCGGNLMCTALGCLTCDDAFGSMPPYHVGPGVVLPKIPDPQSNGRLKESFFADAGNRGSFFYFVLPFLEQQSIFNAGHAPAPSGYSVYRTYSTAPSPKDPTGRTVAYDGTSTETYPPTPPFIGQIPIKTYQCPSDPTMTDSGVQREAGWGACSYACNFLVFGNTTPGKSGLPRFENPDGYDPQANPPRVAPAALPRVKDSFPDGISNTVLIAEKLSVCAWTKAGTLKSSVPGGNLWAWPGDNASYAPAFAMESPWSDATFQVVPPQGQCNVAYPSTGHWSAMRVAMADGSCRTISPSISRETWIALCTPNGGDRIGPDF